MGFGLVMVAASRQRDRFAVYPAAVGLTLYGVFQLLTAVRFWGDLHLGAPGAWLYLAFLVGAVAVGLAGASITRAPEPTAVAAPPSCDAPSAPGVPAVKRPPGPRTFRMIGNAIRFRGDAPAMMTAIARRYGDVAFFRIGPAGFYLLSGPELAHDVLDRVRRPTSSGSPANAASAAASCTMRCSRARTRCTPNSDA